MRKILLSVIGLVVWVLVLLYREGGDIVKTVSVSSSVHQLADHKLRNQSSSVQIQPVQSWRNDTDRNSTYPSDHAVSYWKTPNLSSFGKRDGKSSNETQDESLVRSDLTWNISLLESITADDALGSFNATTSTPGIINRATEFMQQSEGNDVTLDKINLSQTTNDTVVTSDTSNFTLQEISKVEGNLTITIGDRFPRYGTAKFEEQCAWALRRRNVSMPKNCTIYSLKGDNTEGMSQWITTAATGFVFAKQTNCDFRLNYRPGAVDLEHIVQPTSVDWRTPVAHFVCRRRPDNCFVAKAYYSRNGGGQRFFERAGVRLSNVPNYRIPYSDHVKFRQAGRFMGLRTVFGGDFDLFTSFACAVGSMLKLSNQIEEDQKDLLEVVTDTSRLVLSLYVRTGETEETQSNMTKAEIAELYHIQAKHIIDCALAVEQANANVNGTVWMVATDAHLLKKWVHEHYSTARRKVVFSSSRGKHTRENISDTTLGEAFFDWYLIGESDAVVSDGGAPSFGNSAVARTARPHFKVVGGVCTKVETTYKWR